VFVVLSVSDGALENFGDDRCGSSVTESEFFACSVKIFVADEVEYNPYFRS
jgi:hypothetical protein